MSHESAPKPPSQELALSRRPCHNIHLTSGLPKFEPLRADAQTPPLFTFTFVLLLASALTSLTAIVSAASDAARDDALAAAVRTVLDPTATGDILEHAQAVLRQSFDPMPRPIVQALADGLASPDGLVQRRALQEVRQL